MIVNAKKLRQSTASACCAKFLSLLPAIQEQARFAFRNEKPEHRQDLTAEVIANCWAGQARKQITVERLDVFDERTGEWREILIEDRHAGPAETAAARIDIADWFDRLPKRQRRIAATLATGETTKRTARRFRVTPGRISQTRRELHEDWQRYQGEEDLAETTA